MRDTKDVREEGLFSDNRFYVNILSSKKKLFLTKMVICRVY